MENISRRNIIKMSGSAALGLTAFSIVARAKPAYEKKLKIVFVGAHPDDPETGCGGTMSLLSGEGHEVVAAYLTRGEAGIKGKTYQEAASIRTSEALEACKILNAKAKFLSQIDGSCEITANRYTEMYDFLKDEKPDIVFTHWPIDAHRDHRICSILVYDAWLNLKRDFELFYFEVESGGANTKFSTNKFCRYQLCDREKNMPLVLATSAKKWNGFTVSFTKRWRYSEGCKQTANMPKLSSDTINPL